MDLLQNADTAHWSNLHCKKDALTNIFGWFLQAVLATVAFMFLVGKRYFEPAYIRRSWEIWWYDTSKQGIGALFIHMANVYLAPMFQGDPCTWYIINFLLDSTVGLFIIFIGTRICFYVAHKWAIEALYFGEYMTPKSWLYQTWVYIGLMVLIKLTTFLIIQFNFWDNVKEFVLSPFSDPNIELVVVMLIIPFFVNILIFWVTDNFLMLHKRNVKTSEYSDRNLARKYKVNFVPEEEVEALISDKQALIYPSQNDELQSVQQRLNTTCVV